MADPKALPDPDAVAQVSDLEVLDSKGGKVRFGSLFEKEKAVVVFIRSVQSHRDMSFQRST